MRQKFFLLLMASFIFLQCEKVNEDVDTTTPANDEPTGLVENAQSIYYTFQGNSVLLDMTTLIDLPNVANINIVKKPILGTVNFEENFLKYQPNSNIVEASDQFEIEIKGKNGQKKIETIYIDIQAENSEIPCHFGTLPNYYSLKKGATGTFDVLANDKFCDVTYVDNSLKILKNTINGQLTVSENKVTFVPNSTFDKGVDFGVYLIQAKNKDNKVIQRVGLIKIEVEEDNIGNCPIKLINDWIALPDKLTNDTIKISPLLNDKLCTKNGTLSISEQPKFGVAKVDKFSVLYIPNKNIGVGTSYPDDEIAYKYCEGNVCEVAKINISRKDTVKTGTGCVLKLQNDEYTFSLKNTKLNLSKGFVYVDVLKNDVLCDKKNEKTFLIKNIVPSDAKIKIEKPFVRYDAKNQQFEKGEEVSFEYEITNTTGQKFSATAKIKFVD
jgi:hypothetical protein